MSRAALGGNWLGILLNSIRCAVVVSPAIIKEVQKIVRESKIVECVCLAHAWCRLKCVHERAFCVAAGKMTSSGLSQMTSGGRSWR